MKIKIHRRYKTRWAHMYTVSDSALAKPTDRSIAAEAEMNGRVIVCGDTMAEPVAIRNEPTNFDRRSRALKAILCYDGNENEWPHDPQTVIVDLLTDLRHLCGVDGDLDFDLAIESSLNHFQEEHHDVV